MNTLIIIGASGQGKVVADLAVKCGYQNIVFLDDDLSIKKCGKYTVHGNSAMAENIKGDVFVAIGNAVHRKRISELYQKRLTVLVHPAAVIADNVKIGIGTVVMAGAIVNAYTTIGKGCIINVGSSVDHDCSIGDYVHIAVGANLCGTVSVGEETWIGAGTTVSNNINICAQCVIGAGAVVVKDLFVRGVYVGVPAKEIKMGNNDLGGYY